ncbi:MAG: hypothetical protein HGA23_11400 [Bacteroidales bacterium]|nr:hypothetical protein [Bacteroidales bacterium]
MKISLITVILSLIIWMPFYFYEIPAPLVKQDKVMKETADAVRKLGYKDRKVIFFDPKFAFYLNEDPYDHSKLYFRLSDDRKPEFNLADGSLLIWEAYFAEIEKKLDLDGMLRNPNFKLIDGFIPEVDFRFAAKQNYMSFIFQKKTSVKNQNDWVLIDSLDFETAKTEEKMRFLSDSVAFTGNKSVRVNPDCTFSFTSENKLEQFRPAKKVIIRGRAKVFNPGKAIPDKITLVVSVHKANGDMFRYLSKAGSYYNPKVGEWFEMSIVTPLEIEIPENGTVKVYVWYTGKEEIFVDDLVLEYFPVNE